MKAALHRAVLRSRSLPVFGALYRGAYAGALSVASRALFALPGMSSVYLHRGMSRKGWEPGVSDIDFILVGDGGLDAKDGSGDFLARLSSRLAALRRFFPMVGDVWLGTPGELAAYLRWGGLRAWEDVPAWRLLRGRALELPALAESPEKRRWLDPWTEAFMSHMELSRKTFRGGHEVQEKRDSDVRKLHSDVVRYSDFILSDGEPASPAPRPGDRGGREGRTARELWLDSSIRLARASERVLARVASPETASASFPAPKPGGPLDGQLQELLLSVGSATCAVADPPYHTYLLLGAGSSKDDYGQALDALLRTRPPGIALALEPASWALLLQSSYLGGPLGWLGSGEGQASSGGEALFEGWGASALGKAPAQLPLLPPRLAWETAAEAASWMALWWRYLWIGEGWSNRFVLYHLYTRAMGLRILLSGAPSGPLCDWELLLARASARFPEERRFLIRLRESLHGETAASLSSSARGELAQAHLSAAARLVGALQDPLRACDDSHEQV